MYGGPVSYPSNTYPGGDNLMNVNFGGTNYPPNYNARSGFVPQMGYPQNYQGGPYYGQQPMGFGNPNVNTPTSPPREYDKLVAEMQNGVNYAANITEEQKKQAEADKLKKEEQDRFFDSLKF